MIEDALLSAEALKQFVEEICYEMYPNEQSYLTKIDEIERQWPKFHEKEHNTQNGPPPIWSPDRYGRLPPFIQADEGDDYGCLYATSDMV